MAESWGEHDSRECKASFDGSSRDKARLVREIVAMANSGGGILVYGVDDAGVVVGLDSAWDPRVLLTLETRMEHGNQQWCAAEAAEVPRRAA
jgi:predicted HTH transcriptional regulator